MVASPDADVPHPWLLQAIATLQQTLGTLGPEMLPLLTAGTTREKAIARLVQERQPLLRECLRHLPAILAQSDLERYVTGASLAALLQKSREQFCLVVLLSPPK
jgi:hypothetical protein